MFHKANLAMKYEVTLSYLYRLTEGGALEAFIPNLLIALREGVEAALIVGIVVAYIVKVGRRDVLPKLWIAVIVSAAIPLGLGVYWTWGPMTITFQAQEVLGGAFSIIAVGFITWMIFWMGKNSRKMTAELKSKAEAALESGNTTALIWMAAIAVFREGAETAIFVWGVIASSGTTDNVWPAVGVVLGLLIAIVIGYLIYKGSVAINLRLFFNVTGYLLIVVAAGVLLYGIGDLQEASVIPGWGVLLYDFSAVVTPVAGEWWFVLLRAFFNIHYWFYPTHLQFICWITYLVVVLVLFTLQIKGIIFKGKPKAAEVAAPVEEEGAEPSAALDGEEAAEEPASEGDETA